MDSFILGKKKKQSQIFGEKGQRIPTTLIDTTSNYIIRIKTKETDGYNAFVFGYEEGKKIKKSVEGELKKAGIEKKLLHVSEMRIKNDKSFLKDGNTPQIGKEVNPTAFFAKGDLVSVTGTSKGKGFQGVVKRHKFKGGPKTHGQSDRQRAPGAIGMTTTPGRVFKGKRMAGRMGGDTVTIPRLEVIEVNEKGIIVKGLIAGPIGGIVRVKKNSEMHI